MTFQNKTFHVSGQVKYEAGGFAPVIDSGEQMEGLIRALSPERREEENLKAVANLAVGQAHFVQNCGVVIRLS